jgi:hypothetical protein
MFLVGLGSASILLLSQPPDAGHSQHIAPPKFGIGSINCAGRLNRTAAISGTPMNLQDAYQLFVLIVARLLLATEATLGDALSQQPQEQFQSRGIILRLIADRYGRGRRRQGIGRARS